MDRRPGKVFLVGAGPGDPGLITVRGAELLRAADVIVTDALVNPRLLRGARGRVIDAGKRGPTSRDARGHGPSQASINRLLVRLARSGKNVVRLKGGDPFVFGRGSEELEALHAAKIPFEVVPGVTSASAAPAYAGIPITDRRWASHVTFVTGHEKPGKDGEGVDWARLSPRGTLVVMMGVLSWPSFSARLLALGWPARLPVAAIENGSSPRQRVLRASLHESADHFRREKLAAPAVIVVGPVAALGDRLAWFQRERPLLGRRVVVTRAAESNDRLISLLEAEGAVPVTCPLIRIRPLSSPALSALKRVPARAPQDGLIFLSANAVKIFARLWPAAPAALAHIPVVAVGPQTALAAKQAGFQVKYTPNVFTSAGVRRVLGSVKGKHFLLPRARVAPPDLPRALERAGARVQAIPIYETQFLPLSPTAMRGCFEADAVTFLSASSAEALARAMGKAQVKRLFRTAAPISIGPMTTAAVRHFLRVRPHEAGESTSEGVIAALRSVFSRK